MTFRVGQKVVCVDDSPHGSWVGALSVPRAGGIYTIRAIRRSDRVRELQVVLLEIVNECANTELDGFGEAHFKASRFRPVVERKTDISIFEAMLSPDRAAGKPRKRSLVNHT